MTEETVRPLLSNELIERELRERKDASLRQDVERITQAVREQVTYERVHQLLLESGDSPCWFALYITGSNSLNDTNEAVRKDGVVRSYLHAICDDCVWRLTLLGKSLAVTLDRKRVPLKAADPVEKKPMEARETITCALF